MTGPYEQMLDWAEDIAEAHDKKAITDVWKSEAAQPYSYGKSSEVLPS